MTNTHNPFLLGVIKRLNISTINFHLNKKWKTEEVGYAVSTGKDDFLEHDEDSGFTGDKMEDT